MLLNNYNGIPDTSCRVLVSSIKMNNEIKVTDQKEIILMLNFYTPNLEIDLDSPFTRDENNKLIRKSYWMDKSDKSLLMLMDRGIGSQLTNDEKRAHLLDIGRSHLIDDLFEPEILPPE
jgi:hypothetical protein|tara:strand:- start:250 stop:606 length:357 start_codon:yes stop_codon:yes gene_type:complete